MADTKFKLNNGVEIPALGLGYRHVDAAYVYGNEDEVGAGLKDAFDSGVCKREDVFVTTKLWCTYHQRAEEGLDKSLSKLGLDYVDLFLMHWPVAMNPKGNHDLIPKRPDGTRDLVPLSEWSHLETWKSMEKLLATGKVKAIGIANYSLKYLPELLSIAKVVPAVNQIENHPSLPQQEIVDFCKEKGIHITAYSPLGSTGSPMLTSEPVVAVAKKKNVTPASILLSYHIARGSSVLAKSVNPDRIKANMDLIKLDSDDMKTLNDYSDELKKTGKLVRYVYPAFGFDLGFPDKS